MGIGSQSLTGQDLGDFKDVLDNATRKKRAEIDQKLADIVQESITELGTTASKNLKDRIATKIRARILVR